MIICKKNKMVGWINIIFGVLGCIGWFFAKNCATMEDRAYINFTSEQETTFSVMLILMAITLVLTFIINFIYIFRNWHNKKSMILNILSIVSVIISITLTYIFETHKCIYINLIIAILGILLLIFNKNENLGKKHRILFGIMIINLVLLIISSIGFIFVRNDYEVKYTNNEKNLMKNIMQISNGSNTTLPIKVKKNDKWGYITSDGKCVIDFIYDDCSDFLEIKDKDNNKKYYIATVCIGNELKIITSENKQVASYINIKRERINGCDTYLFYEIEEELIEDSKKINSNIETKNNTYSLYSGTYKEYKYNSYSDYYSTEILTFKIDNDKGKSSELLYNTETESITYNGRKVSIDGYIDIYESDEDNYSSKYRYIDAYENGYIPIYNFEKETFGWMDLKGKTYYINGKKQILDINDKYITIKDYSIMDEVNVYIADYEGNRISDYYKEILILEKGYVVKKANNKNVYLDDNLQPITQEYDIMDVCRVEDGILIVSNFYRLSDNINNLSFDVININTGKVVGTNLEYISGMNEYKYNANMYEELTDEQYKEILSSLGYEFINTYLYEKHYK